MKRCAGSCIKDEPAKPSAILSSSTSGTVCASNVGQNDLNPPQLCSFGFSLTLITGHLPTTWLGGEYRILLTSLFYSDMRKMSGTTGQTRTSQKRTSTILLVSVVFGDTANQRQGKLLVLLDRLLWKQQPIACQVELQLLASLAAFLFDFLKKS